MKLKPVARDRLLCALGAALLLASASGIIFGWRPGGFETQVAWTYGLLPGEFPAQITVFAFESYTKSTVPNVVVQVPALAISFAWYYLVCFVALRIWRRAGGDEISGDGWWPRNIDNQ